MEDHKVLITTSGLGSRLGNLTSHTNKSLVRVGNMPTISHIVKSYPKETDFVVTLGHFGQHVRDYLELAHPNRNFSFVEVDKYEGPGTSLAYSILQAKEALQQPFIFHACDSIITDKLPLDLNKSWCIGAKKQQNSQYRTLRVSDDKVLNINEKGELCFDYSYVGVCKIVEYNTFWSCLESLDFSKSDASDCHVINDMIEKGCEFSFFETKEWHDIGNTSELVSARKHFSSDHNVLDKDDESIFFVDDHVIKFFSNSNIAADRVARATKMSDVFPKVLDSRKNFYKYRFIEGTNFGSTVTRRNFSELLSWSKKNLWSEVEIDNASFREQCKKFYFEKTRSRIQKYYEVLGIDFESEPVIINEERVGKAEDLISRLSVDWLSDGEPTRFHGDFILDNIVMTPEKSFVLIDWRQDFAGSIEAGDLYYDFAKLNHNLVFNHEIVNDGHFHIEEKNGKISCDILRSEKLVKCQKDLLDFAEENDLDVRKIRTLSAIIWINMAPLHQYPLSKFLFNFGKYNLYCMLEETNG